MTPILWFISGTITGILIGAALFYHYKTTMTTLIENLEAKFERLVGILNNWQKDVTKKL